MRLHTHLSFNGDCRQAFEFYEKALGGKISFLMTYGDSPMAAQSSDDWHTKIIHASFIVGDQELSGADAPPSVYQKPQGTTVMMGVDEAGEAERIFAALSEGATVQLALQETFWALRFGMLVDRFGTPWMINCSRAAA